MSRRRRKKSSRPRRKPCWDKDGKFTSCDRPGALHKHPGGAPKRRR